jgi:indolepyruvate ferredoxin oxidoreductase beta subunit
MGAASYALPFEVPTWERVISDRVPPRTVEANLRAFHLGRDACAEGVCSL